MKMSSIDNPIVRLIRLSWCLMVVGLALTRPVSAIADIGRDTNVWDGDPLTVAGLDVRVEEQYPDELEWPDLAKAVIGLYLAPDQLMTRKNLDDAEKALSPFGRVRSTVELDGQQANVVILFTPYKRIKSIRIKGNYPLFERDVRNAMEVAVGDIFRPQEMPDEEQRIVQLYSSRGFIDPKVAISATPDPSDGHRHLRVVIDEGPFYRMASVTISGNRAMTDLDLKSRLSVWRRAVLWVGEGRFEPLDLKKDIEKLTGYYRSFGFYNVQITAQTALDSQKQRAEVALAIDEGPLYTVAFKGNSFFSASELQKDLVLEEMGNLANKGLRRSIQALRKRYLEAGFSDVQVKGEEITDTADENSRTLEFTIDEGLRRIVNRVSILGMQKLDKHLIQDQILTRPPDWPHKGIYVKQVLEEDLAALRSLYLQQGFLSTQVLREVRTDDDSGRVDVIITIDEGVRTRVRKVTLVTTGGKSPVPTDKLMGDLKMASGDPYSPFMIEEEENNLSAIIAAMGYPHVQVSGKAVLSSDQTRADIAYTIDSGPLVKLGEIFIAGNFRTRKNFIKYQAGLIPGQVFSLKDVVEGQRDVRDLRIFDSVQLNTIGLKEKAATVPLLITVAEKNPYFFELGGGYQSDKGFYGRTKAGDNNLVGSGKQLWMGAESSEVGYRWEAGFNEPRLLGIRLGLDTGIFTERNAPFNKDFGTETTGSTVGLSRRWGQFFNTHLGLRYEQRRQFRQDDQVLVEDPALLDRRAVWVTTPAVTYDDRDSFIRPTKGLLAFLAVDISKGLDNELDDYLRYRFDARWFQPFAKDLVLATRLGIGYLHPYGETDELLQDQLFYLGGTTTVRGFAENLLRQDGSGTAIGGQLAVWGSIEGRYQLWGNWELALFVDTGSLSQTGGDVGTSDFRWSAGIGLQYATPIGPIGLFYGHKLDPLEGESQGRWHFSIGYTF